MSDTGLFCVTGGSLIYAPTLTHIGNANPKTPPIKAPYEIFNVIDYGFEPVTVISKHITRGLFMYLTFSLTLTRKYNSRQPKANMK